MNKFRFTIKNALLYYKFWNGYKLNKIEYPDILEYLSKNYGAPVFIDDFKNLSNWKITDRNEWGSARPENLCVFTKENVAIISNGESDKMVINTISETASGKSWNGEEIPRQFTSGLVTSKKLLSTGQVVSATINASNSYPGSWFSFWLCKTDETGDDRYREIDIFEKFMEREGQQKYTVTVHGGTRNAREMMNFSYPLFFVDEEKITFTCELNRENVKIFINGIQICLAEEPDFEGEYYIMINDGPSTYGGKVPKESITGYLPGTLEIIDFRIYEKGRPN